jgi:hypothetical protein
MQPLKIIAIVFVCVTTLSTGAHAQMYKCVGQNGSMTFQDQPCEKHQQQKEVAKKPPMTKSPQTAGSADHRAAFREMALAWGLENYVRKNVNEKEAQIFDLPEMVTDTENSLIDSLKLQGFQGREYQMPELRAVARKYALPLLKLAKMQVLDYSGQMSAFETEYIQVFTAQELREMAAYYSATGEQAGMASKPPQSNAAAVRETYTKSSAKQKQQQATGFASSLQSKAYARHREVGLQEVNSLHDKFRQEVFGTVLKNNPALGRN